VTCSAQIDGLRSSLIAVTDYRDGPAAKDRGICFVRGEKPGHLSSSLRWKFDGMPFALLAASVLQDNRPRAQ
jgi:hypothetical protein